MKRTRLAIIVVGALCGATCTSGFSVGIINADFENPLIGTGATYDYTPAGFGWNLAWGQFDLYGTQAQAASGKQFVDLNGWVAGGLYQDFTFPGAGTWQIQFAMSANPDTSELKSLKMTLTPAGGTAINLGTFTMNPAGRTWSNLGWQNQWSPTFITDAPTTYRLEVDSLNLTGPSGPLIDNFQLVAVPEPATGLLVLAGLVLCAAKARQSAQVACQARAA